MISLKMLLEQVKDNWGRLETSMWYGFNPDTKQYEAGPNKGKTAQQIKDNWGRPITSMWYGFNPDTKQYEAGPNKGKTAQQVRKQMTAKAEALAYQPKTSKATPWPIQVNYYAPLDKKFPTGHIECRSLREPQYQMNANPIQMDYVDIILGGKETKNFWNMPMTGKKIPDKPSNAHTIYIYLTDQEYDKFKKTTPALNLKLGYKADKLAQSVKSPNQAIQNYNVLTQNCADGVALALGAKVEKWTSTEKIIVGAATLLSPILSLVGQAGAVVNELFDITLPADVFIQLKKVYKGRITHAIK